MPPQWQEARREGVVELAILVRDYEVIVAEAENDVRCTTYEKKKKKKKNRQ